MINDGGNRIHLWNMWKCNFKSAQVYRQHKAGGLHIVIEITQNASLRLICHTPYEQCLDQWQHQYRQHIPTVDSFSPECDIMFPKVLGSLRVSGVSGVSESQNHELYYSRGSSTAKPGTGAWVVFLRRPSHIWRWRRLIIWKKNQCSVIQSSGEQYGSKRC